MQPSSKIDDKPQTLVGVSFTDAFRAQEFMTAASRLAANHKLQVHDAVVVAKTDDGHTRVVETIDPQPGRSALSGAMWTGLLGLLLAGPVGWIAGGVIGAGAGAVAAKVVDLGVPDEWVDWFREAVQPGTTTVVLLLTDVNVDALVNEAKRFTGAELIYANLDAASFDRVVVAFGGTPGTHTASTGGPSDPTPSDSAPFDQPPAVPAPLDAAPSE